MKIKLWKIIYAFFRIPLFEQILQYLVSGKYSDSFAVRLVPPFYTYPNPTNRVAKKNRLRLQANLNDYNDWKAFWGILEYERENLYKLATGTKIVIDVGSNNGWVLMNIAAIITKNGGFVYGFEPFPETYKRCIKNIEYSNLTNTQVVNMGCGEVESLLQMQVVTENNSGQNRIVENDSKHYATVPVKVTTLDNQFGHVGKVDLIKIDVEGFELHVVKGAQAILAKNKPVVFIEINDPLLKANNTTPWEVLNFLENNFQYTFCNALNNRPISKGQNFDNCQLDIICYPPAK
ncbi:MAG: FkbM family methyltransferase [Panacibacter sp.]